MALAIESRVPPLDAPFGALGANVCKSLRQWSREIHDRTALMTVFVAHDRSEAMELAHRFAVLNQGEIEQVGTPREINQNPSSAFMREFPA